MTYVLDISTKARNQLWEIANWYGETASSNELGLRWYYGFQNALESLIINPESHGIARESHRFPFELRELLYGSGRRKTHRAVFRIVGDRVEVLTIRHVAQRDLTPEDLQ